MADYETLSKTNISAFFIGDDGETYFAHGNELQKSGINVLPPAGSRFSFDVEQNSKGFRALNIEVEA
jgi:cold shock CspA family protein